MLPFQSMAGDTANSYFAEGMAEEVATALAKVPGLQLAGRNSASAHSGKSPQEIGKLLGVGAVLQGSVRRAGERMRISVELTNASSGIVMWTESYEREVKDVFAVQDEISRQIVSALRMKLGGGGTATRMAGRGTENMDAYDDYLRGVYQYQRRGAGVQLAVKAFSDAIAKDSTFARAWAGLGQALVSSTEYADAPIRDVLPRAQAAAAQAVRLAPDLAEAQLAAATAAMFADQWAEAEPLFRRAIELDSSLALAHQFYARFLWASGRIEQAVTQALTARTLDPLNSAVLGNLGPILTAAGRREEGFETARDAFEMDSTVQVAITGYAHTAVAAGKLSEARAFGDRVLRYSTDPRARGAAAYALGRGGDTARARAVYEEMVRRHDEWRTAMARARAMFGLGERRVPSAPSRRPCSGESRSASAIPSSIRCSTRSAKASASRRWSRGTDSIRRSSTASNSEQSHAAILRGSRAVPGGKLLARGAVSAVPLSSRRRVSIAPGHGAVARAEQALAADPRSVAKIIDLGVAQSGVLQFREAIATFTKGMAIEPDNAMLYRWRGHRHLSVRELDRAMADLTRGYALDSLNYGVLYHLGIVRFARGDFNAAVDAFQRSTSAPECGRAGGSTDWLWMSLMRAGRAGRGAGAAGAPPDSLPVNNAYTTRLKLYREEIGPDQVFTPADTAGVQVATLSYGLGNWYLVRGDTTAAKGFFQRAVAANAGWAGFGFIVSEVELRRLGGEP